MQPGGRLAGFRYAQPADINTLSIFGQTVAERINFIDLFGPTGFSTFPGTGLTLPELTGIYGGTPNALTPPGSGFFVLYLTWNLFDTGQIAPASDLNFSFIEFHAFPDAGSFLVSVHDHVES